MQELSEELCADALPTVFNDCYLTVEHKTFSAEARRWADWSPRETSLAHKGEVVMSGSIKSLARFAAPAGLAALLAAFAPASASAEAYAGSLECSYAGGEGGLVVESLKLDCSYEDEDGSIEHYVGELTNVGAVIGVTGPGDLAWGVLVESHKVGAGALAGDYVGPHGAFAIGGGVGASVLVGGSHDSVSLQPIAVQGGTGLNISAGIAHLTLTYAPEAQPRHHRKHHRRLITKP